MPAGRSNYDQIYRVVGASQAVAANRRVGGSINRLNQAVRAGTSGLMGMRSALSGNAMAIAALGLGVSRATSEYGRYTMAVARVNTVLAAQTVNHRQNTRLVRDVAESVGRNLGYSLGEANDAMTTMLQTGLGAHRSMRVFGTAMQLARVAGMDTSNSTQFLTDTMNMFRVEQARTGETSRQFSRRMSSQLIVAANSASTSVEQLQQSFRYAGGEMSSLGYSSQDTMAALAALSSVGLRGTTAGTRLRGAIAALHTPSSTTRQMFQQWGVSQEELNTILYTSEGRLRQLSGPGGAMQQLSALVQRLPSQQARNTAIIRLFGRRALAAGAALTGLSEAGERAARIGERLQRSDVRSGSILDETTRVSMNSFGMQLQQLKEGVRDLAITFGEVLFSGLQTGERGFGTVFREMVRGIRLAGDLTNMTADQRREWNAMSPETRRQATELRTFFGQIATGIQWMGRLAMIVVRLITEYPRLTLALIAFRLVMGGGAMMTAGRMFIGMLTNTSAWMARNTTAAAGASRGMQALGVVMGAFAVHAIGMATDAMQRQFIEMSGLTREYEEMRSHGVGAAADWMRQIPVIGHLAAQYLELGGSIAAAVSAYDDIQERRRREREQTISATANARLEAIMASRRRAAGGEFAPGQEDTTRAREASLASSRSTTRTATLMWASGARTAAQVSEQLASAGLQGERLAAVTEQIVQYQQNNRAMLQHDAERMVERGGIWEGWQRDFGGATSDSVRQLVGFQNILQQINSEGAEFGVAPTLGAGASGETSIPTAGDAFINRSGVIRATAGDVLVNRASLAEAITSAPGGLTGPILGQERTMAGPPASGGGGGGGGGGGMPPIIIQIDGREIARAVGREHATHLERSGASFEPGQRRTMRETGFTERLG